jgi:hypothetical protein
METSMTDGTFSGEPNTFKVLLGKVYTFHFIASDALEMRVALDLE